VSKLLCFTFSANLKTETNDVGFTINPIQKTKVAETCSYASPKVALANGKIGNLTNWFAEVKLKNAPS